MDPEKSKTTATTTITTGTTTTVATSPVKCSMKVQARHQEHNYTNTSKTGESCDWDESSVAKTTSNTIVTTAPSSSSVSSSMTTVVASSSDSTTETPRASYSGTKSGGGGGFFPTSQFVQPTSTLSGDKHAYEVRSRGIKKDVFNRIRRSEEELQKAAEMVRGGMTFQTASDTFKIPISTIRFYMARRGILPQRRRGRGSSGVRDDDLIHPPFEIIHYRLPDIDRPV